MDVESWLKESEPLHSCESCNSNEISGEFHSCPFQEEINNDYEFECNCCESCIIECTMSI